ncbi:MAG: hypothetical protein ACE145_11465 [Terriglobia bacterium]
MSFRHALRRALPLLLVLAAVPAQGEGPLYVGGDPSIPSADITGTPIEGKAFHFDPANFPLDYWTDQGGVGSMTKAQSDNLVQQAFAAWEGIGTASITFNKAGDLGDNVTATNALAVINAVSDCSTLPGSPAGPIAKPRTIIYDDSLGSIISALDEDPNVVLGFADAVCFSGNGTDNFINRGYAVLNGKMITATNASSLLLPVMIHEFGHMIGLDHSQVNVNCLGFCGAVDSEGLPTMFPILVDPEAMSTPAVDDIAGISALYPSATFASTTGTITGTVYFSDGLTPAAGFNVIARRVGDPRITASSSVSGFLFTGDAGNPIYQDPASGTPSPFGSHQPGDMGKYSIPGLPPGTYTLEVEGIHNTGSDAFTAGSGLNPVGYLGFEFNLLAPCSPLFLGSNSLTTCVSSGARTISVTAGSTMPADIFLTGTTGELPCFDAWENGPTSDCSGGP